MSTYALKPPKLRRYHILESISSKTFIPREYQVELLDSARKKNTIICLGTGTGKTFIAVMLIKEFSHLVRDSLSNGGKRTIFLAPTVPLVIQQAKFVRDCTDLRVGQYFGLDLEKWPKEKWLKEVETHQVLAMTPDLFCVILYHGFLPLSSVNLIIFDECHNAVRNHPYCKIMNYFDVCEAGKEPRILGMSASLINNKCRPSAIDQQIKQLEAVLKSHVETATELTSLSKYGSKPKEFIVLYNSYSDDDPILTTVISKIKAALEFLNFVNVPYDEDDPYPHPCHQPKRYLVELSYVISSLGLWCSLRAIKLFLEEIDMFLDSSHWSYLPAHKVYIVLTRTVLVMAEKEIHSLLGKNNILSNLVERIPPKMKRLLEVLKPYKPEPVTPCNAELINGTCINNSCDTEAQNSSINNQNGQALQNNQKTSDTHSELEANKCNTYKRKYKSNNFSDDSKVLCCLIFVRQRIAAYLLSEWLAKVKENDPDFSFLSPSYIIGHGKNTSGLKNAAMKFQKQEEVLQKFRTKLYNIVVATSVIEEGMDIPKCNLVIRFDRPENFRAYVQSKGRARVNDSHYIMMVKSPEKETFEEIISDYKTVEELLLMKCHKADQDMEETVLENSIDNLIEPYMPVKQDGYPRVTLSTAIALVNRYCAKLPSDTFTRLTPKWKIIEDIGLTSPFQCVLKLPINSPLKKPIEGQWMQSKQLAKMAVALKTCEELHKAGELDDNLLPTGKEAVKAEDFMFDDKEDYFKKDEDARKDPARPGTTKRRLYYFKRVADALKNSAPSPSSPCYLYVFDMKLTCPIPEEQNTRGRKIHDPSDTARGFGILTGKIIPPICSFPVFTRSGEVTVSLKPISYNFTLEEEKLDALAFFHRYTFSDVLRLEKYPMSYKPSESEASYYVVPITLNNAGNCVIDWPFVDLIFEQNTKKPQKASENERKNFKFITDDYQDAVVMPWYRNLDKPQFFYVAEICTSLTPLSEFPDNEYDTFAAYYQKKYDIMIMNHNQPLLDVDHTSARLNLLTPRYVNRKGVTLPTSSEQTKRTKRENLQQKQILIPELCTVHPFPAYLWRKTVCLPCILYRLNSLLLAEQLRLVVANSIPIGVQNLPSDFQWPPLDFGWTLADILNSQSTNKENETEQQLTKYVKNENVKNGYFTPKPTNFSNESNSVNNFENTYNNDLMDFEIDVFDPTKVVIPDDDKMSEYLLDQEIQEAFGMDNSLGNIDNMFSSNPVFPVPLWQPISEECENDERSVVRYGSPSNFEDSNWDSEWDTEINDNPFLAVNFRGLGYISAPGVNMQSLTMDLATCKDDEMWDSMDESSVISDDDENFPIITHFETNEQTEKELKALPKSTKTYEEMSECSWLTFHTLKDESPEMLCSSDAASCVPTSITTVKNNKKKDINYLNSAVDSKDTVENLSLENLLQTAFQAESSWLSDANINNNDTESDCDNFILNGRNTTSGTNSEHTLAFGELLPNRENHQLYDNMNRVSFDDNPDLSKHPGPSPSIILQALTMSNANDGINLERLETVGDSFLKYAITVYLFCTYPNIHEGKLSYLRSKQISNYNLYKLGKRKGLGELMVASKFEPYDNWLPPNYVVPKGLEEALIESGISSGSYNLGNLKDLTQMSEEEVRQTVLEKTDKRSLENACDFPLEVPNGSSMVPYNLLTQHSIPDKSIADCVEALIGAYLVSCGSRGALLFMSWLGLKVLPVIKVMDDNSSNEYGFLTPPPSPILTREPKSDLKLMKLLNGYSAFEDKIDYSFNDKSYLLQAFTHASYRYNTLTDCYQRLEFLGDAVLDYLITRHLYEDPKKHSPGTLTDLRSALVNNTFFASLAVKYDFHKFFKSISPALFNVINKFVQLKENNARMEDYLDAYYLEEDECEEMEDVEVPKALGDIFESVAGAIYLDSNMSLDTVWRVYYTMMKPEIEYFSNHVPKSPIRELLELEPQTAKFERAEMTVSGKVRVCVDVFGKGKFVGVGRNKRIAKSTAAKHALRELKKHKKS
ncbi:endoribonuclease Dicer isoform X2 [Parasteatoda tepidariorum]|nr:endoribonuclease Dicer isoform X3 [Parasteatoda tepidariorum]